MNFIIRSKLLPRCAFVQCTGSAALFSAGRVRLRLNPAIEAAGCISGIRCNANAPTGNSGSHKSGSDFRLWHIWKFRRVRLVLRALRVGALSVALYQVGVQTGLQMYANDPRGQRESMINEIRGKSELKGSDSQEAKCVQRVFPRVLQAAVEEARCRKKEINEQLKENPKDKDLQEKLVSVKSTLRLLKMWPQDGFVILNNDSPNAFVTPMIPGLVFIHSGILDKEHAVPVEDFGTLLPGTELRMLLRAGVNYYRPDTKKWVKFNKDTLWDCQFVGTQENKNERNCVVKLQYAGRFVCLCVPEKDVNKRWTYSICGADEHLAMLLGHELSHVIHGHTVDSTYLKAAVLVFQLVALSVLDVTGLASMLTVLGMAPALQYSIELPFSRDQEFEADATGLRVAARAGYSPHDASGFFERLTDFSAKYGETGGRNWNSTHPTNSDRIKRLRELEADATEYYKRSQGRQESNGSSVTRKELVLAVATLIAVGVIAAIA